MTRRYFKESQFTPGKSSAPPFSRPFRYLTLIESATLGIAFVGLIHGTSVAETNAVHKKPKPTPCTPSISKCGCTIETTGFYQVTKDLSLPGGTLNDSDQSCINVSAPRVGLYLAGTTIINKLTSGGIGIHLSSSAANSFIEGAGATLSGWNYGIEDNASNVIITNVSADANATAGFLIQSASGVAITNFGAHGNGQYGVLLNGTSVSQISGGAVNPPANPGIQNNGLAGIKVSTNPKPVLPSSGVRIFGNCVTGNLGSGIVLDGNVFNSRVSGNEVTDNSAGDLIDLNNNCGSNLWFGNAFGVGSPVTCIGQSAAVSVCPNS
jgi:hypothetical protein